MQKQFKRCFGIFRSLVGSFFIEEEYQQIVINIIVSYDFPFFVLRCSRFFQQTRRGTSVRPSRQKRLAKRHPKSLPLGIQMLPGEVFEQKRQCLERWEDQTTRQNIYKNRQKQFRHCFCIFRLLVGPFSWKIVSRIVINIIVATISLFFSYHVPGFFPANTKGRHPSAHPAKNVWPNGIRKVWL